MCSDPPRRWALYQHPPRAWRGTSKNGVCCRGGDSRRQEERCSRRGVTTGSEAARRPGPLRRRPDPTRPSLLAPPPTAAPTPSHPSHFIAMALTLLLSLFQPFLSLCSFPRFSLPSHPTNVTSPLFLLYSLLRLLPPSLSYPIPTLTHRPPPQHVM